MQLSKGQRVTATVMAVVVVLVILYDVFAVWYFGHDSGSSISWTTFMLSRDHPIIAFAIGFLCGHIYAGMQGIKVYEPPLQ